MHKVNFIRFYQSDPRHQCSIEVRQNIPRHFIINIALD